MSGPYDVPDDPDEVTLWAGRLRAWPTPPVAPDEVDDETAVSPRRAPADEAVRVAREAPADETVRVAREAPADETVRVAREVPADETVRVAREAPADETVRVSREVLADDTVRVAREVPAVDETTAPRRRRGTGSGPVAPADTEDEAPTGDTAVGTRRSRSRARVEAAEIASGDPVPALRQARVPGADHELYRPRADDAIRATRTVPPARPIDAPDAAEVRPHTPRRARTRGVVLAVTVVVLVAAAAIALFLLMG